MSTFTYDIETQIGKLRLMIGDDDLTTTTGRRAVWSCNFTDEELQLFLDDEDTINQAAAVALETIASSRARLAIKQTLGDQSEDLTLLAKALRNQAEVFRSRDEAPAYDIAEVPCDEFSHRESLL